MEYKDYYKILGVDKQTASDEIKKVYRKLARKFHPDVNPGDTTAEDRFKEINEAYQVLTDPEARAKYDRLGASWQAYQQSQNQGGFDWSQWVSKADNSGKKVDFNDILSGFSSDKSGSFSDFFEAIFGGMEIGKQATTPQKGQDYNQSVEISLEEAFTGTSRILRIGGRRLEVKIPKGARTGTRVRVRGEGASGTGGGPKGG